MVASYLEPPPSPAECARRDASQLSDAVCRAAAMRLLATPEGVRFISKYMREMQQALEQSLPNEVSHKG